MSMNDNLTGLPKAAVDLSKLVAKSAQAHHRKLMRRFLSEKEAAQVGDVYFLGSSSAKVLHSAGALGYLNVVQYLAPADRATLSFLNDFPAFKEEVLKTGKLEALDRALREAARQEPLWAPFAGSSPEVARGETARLLALQAAPKNEINYTLPDYRNRVLSLCPFASPLCRAVCLNTSGQGGLSRTGSLETLVRGPARQDGYTHTSDLSYLYLRGFKAFYGGESNSVTAARIRRTHVMLLSWMREGVLDNSYNEMLLFEAERFIAGSRKLGVPMALRLNGTSDYPAHTLRVRGENLMSLVSRQGVICYDYTKHYQKMKAWMDAGSFKVPRAAGIVEPARLRGGFPSNYHLVFSWSENNAKRALDVLGQGGNVVMVFRRASEVLKAKEGQLPKEAGGKGLLPTHISLAQLGGEEVLVDVVNGDAHDLRFLDPYNVGRRNAGIVVGLVAKGSALKPYRDDKRRETWQHFTSPVVLRRMEKGVAAEIRTNPAPASVEHGAVQEVDPDLVQAATRTVGGFQIVPTGLGN